MENLSHGTGDLGNGMLQWRRPSGTHKGHPINVEKERRMLLLQTQKMQRWVLKTELRSSGLQPGLLPTELFHWFVSYPFKMKSPIGAPTTNKEAQSLEGIFRL